MAYNLYQVQMAKAWCQRIEKENNTAERFWMRQAAQEQMPDDCRSLASVRTGVSSQAPSGFSSKTTFLRSKLEQLEGQLEQEKQHRKKVEADLRTLKDSQRLLAVGCQNDS